MPGKVVAYLMGHANVDAVRQQAAGAFVPQIVPMQVDLPELGAINTRARLFTCRVVTARDEQQRFPCGLEAVLEFSFR